MKTFSPQKSYEKDEILDCAEGNLFGPTNGRLPTSNISMFGVGSLPFDGPKRLPSAQSSISSFS